jgi:hypothetical protein
MIRARRAKAGDDRERWAKESSRSFLIRQNQRGFRTSRAHARLLVEEYERAALFASLSTVTGH